MDLLEYIVCYAFEHDTGDIDCEFCQPEIAAGRCQSKVGSIDMAQCQRCLIEQFKKRWREAEGL